MIRGEYAVLRTSEADDAYPLRRLFDPSRPSSSMLDRTRDMVVPTLDELREMLNPKDKQAGTLYTVENFTGDIVGLCGIRGVQTEVRYGEVLLMFFRDEIYDSPLADEVYAFLYNRAFSQQQLNKVMAHCLDTETAFRGFLLRKGFQSNGSQREVFFTRGEWRDLESLTLFGPRLEGGPTHGQS